MAIPPLYMQRPISDTCTGHKSGIMEPSSYYLLLTAEIAEIMEKLEKTAPKKEEPVAAPNHTEKIKSQVLAKIGRPPRLDRVEVSRHHGGNYRVNIWAHPEPNKNIDITLDARIVSSYYLKVSDTGEIIRSDPPLDKLFSAA
jgi:hypothetical protein